MSPSNPVEFCVFAKPDGLKVTYDCTRNGNKLELSPKTGPKWISLNDGVSVFCEWSNCSIRVEEDKVTGQRITSFHAVVNANLSTSQNSEKGPFNVYLQFFNAGRKFPLLTLPNVPIYKDQPAIEIPIKSDLDFLRATTLELSVGQGCWV